MSWPLLNSGEITLPQNDRLIAQIVGLERRVSRGGKDSIGHPPHGHDDVLTPLRALSAPSLASARSILSSGTTIAPGVVAHRQATNCFGSSKVDYKTPNARRVRLATAAASSSAVRNE
jgi:hypothetical protein